MDAANASWWPSLSGSFSAGRSKQSHLFPESNVFSGSLQASYEIDIWGKLNNQRQAAAMDLAATRDSLEATAMTLAAEVTDTWFGWVAQQAQLQLLEKQLETNSTYLEQIEVRFAEGQQPQSIYTTFGNKLSKAAPNWKMLSDLHRCCAIGWRSYLEKRRAS